MNDSEQFAQRLTAERAQVLVQIGFRPAPPGYQPEPDLHEIEMIGSDLWIKDKESES